MCQQPWESHEEGIDPFEKKKSISGVFGRANIELASKESVFSSVFFQEKN